MEDDAQNKTTNNIPLQTKEINSYRQERGSRRPRRSSGNRAKGFSFLKVHTNTTSERTVTESPGDNLRINVSFVTNNIEQIGINENTLNNTESSKIIQEKEVNLTQDVDNCSKSINSIRGRTNSGYRPRRRPFTRGYNQTYNTAHRDLNFTEPVNHLNNDDDKTTTNSNDAQLNNIDINNSPNSVYANVVNPPDLVGTKDIKKHDSGRGSSHKKKNHRPKNRQGALEQKSDAVSEYTAAQSAINTDLKLEKSCDMSEDSKQKHAINKSSLYKTSCNHDASQEKQTSECNVENAARVYEGIEGLKGETSTVVASDTALCASLINKETLNENLNNRRVFNSRGRRSRPLRVRYRGIYRGMGAGGANSLPVLNTATLNTAAMVLDDKLSELAVKDVTIT